jgi:hypothetical protein
VLNRAFFGWLKRDWRALGEPGCAEAPDPLQKVRRGIDHAEGLAIDGPAALRREEDLEAQAAKPLHLGRIDVQRPAFRGAELVA